MKNICTYANYICLILLLGGCLNKPKFELIRQVQPDDVLNQLLVYKFNDGSSTKIVSLDLQRGEIISEIKTEYADGQIYLFPSKFRSVLKKAAPFENIKNTKEFGIWGSSLNERYIYYSDDAFLFFNPQTQKVNLNGIEYEISDKLLENLVANDLEGGVDPWVNQLVLFRDKIALLKTAFINPDSKLNTELIKQDTTTGSVDSILLDLEITDVVHNLSRDDSLVLHQDCKIYKYSSNQETPQYLINLPGSAEICTNITQIGSGTYVYVDYDSGALGYTKELKLYSVENQRSIKLFSVKAEYGYEANLTYSIFVKS